MPVAGPAALTGKNVSRHSHMSTTTVLTKVDSVGSTREKREGDADVVGGSRTAGFASGSRGARQCGGADAWLRIGCAQHKHCGPPAAVGKEGWWWERSRKLTRGAQSHQPVGSTSAWSLKELLKVRMGQPGQSCLHGAWNLCSQECRQVPAGVAETMKAGPTHPELRASPTHGICHAW